MRDPNWNYTEETDSDIDAILREFGYTDDIEVVELDEVWDD